MLHKINVVWIKRDLRTQDHEPLFFAEKANIPYIILYIFDSKLLKHPDVGVRHLQFIYQSIKALNTTLEPYNKTLSVFYGTSLEIFKFLSQQYQVENLFSYQESGIQKSWDRDIGVSKFLKTKGFIGKNFNKMGLSVDSKIGKLGRSLERIYATTRP